MKNILKLVGIIALVVVIGFSMVSCGGDDGNGGGGNINNINWEGRWESGTRWFELKADKSWETSYDSGTTWEFVANHNSQGPALVFSGGTDRVFRITEVFSNTMIVVENGYTLWDGTYEKLP